MNTITGSAPFQLLRCKGVARRSRGYHASGTEIILPSSKSTDRRSSVKTTFLTRSSALSAKMLIPGIYQM
jgi:hypothetical protein